MKKTTKILALLLALLLMFGICAIPSFALEVLPTKTIEIPVVGRITDVIFNNSEKDTSWILRISEAVGSLFGWVEIPIALIVLFIIPVSLISLFALVFSLFYGF